MCIYIYVCIVYIYEPIVTHRLYIEKMGNNDVDRGTKSTNCMATLARCHEAMILLTSVMMMMIPFRGELKRLGRLGCFRYHLKSYPLLCPHPCHTWVFVGRHFAIMTQVLS